MMFELQWSNIDIVLYDLYCDRLRGCSQVACFTGIILSDPRNIEGSLFQKSR